MVNIYIPFILHFNESTNFAHSALSEVEYEIISTKKYSLRKSMQQRLKRKQYPSSKAFYISNFKVIQTEPNYKNYKKWTDDDPYLLEPLEMGCCHPQMSPKM